MIFNKKIKIDLLVSKDETRRAMCYVLFREDYLVATDGHVLAKIQIERDETDPNQEILIKPQVFEFIRRNFTSKRKDEEDVTIEFSGHSAIINKNYTIKHAIEYNNTRELIYPKWETVIPEDTTKEISFNPKLLDRLSKAMNYDYSISLSILDKTKAILVTSGEQTDLNRLNKVLIMPMRSREFGDGK